jgi:hypothetical protein
MMIVKTAKENMFLYPASNKKIWSDKREKNNTFAQFFLRGPVKANNKFTLSRSNTRDSKRNSYQIQISFTGSQQSNKRRKSHPK